LQTSIVVASCITITSTSTNCSTNTTIASSRQSWQLRIGKAALFSVERPLGPAAIHIASATSKLLILTPISFTLVASEIVESTRQTGDNSASDVRAYLPSSHWKRTRRRAIKEFEYALCLVLVLVTRRISVEWMGCDDQVIVRVSSAAS